MVQRKGEVMKMSYSCLYISLGWVRDAKLCMNSFIQSSDTGTDCYIINVYGFGELILINYPVHLL